MGVTAENSSVQGRPLTIAIPLLSQRIAKDWPKMCLLIQQTLNALANQTLKGTRVLIACHEVPDVAVPAGLDVEFISVAFDPPRFTWEMEVDKLKKQEVMGSVHRAAGGGKLFFLDADDLLDREFAATVAASKAKVQIIGRGYKLNHARQRVTVLPRFWRRCGSSVVVDWRPEELPEVPLTDQSTVYRRFLDTRHYEWPQFCQAQGWSLEYVQKPMVIYVVNHGQNDSDVLSKPSLRWKLYNTFLPSVNLTDEFRARFSLA
jgi:hypothetical protein